MAGPFRHSRGRAPQRGRRRVRHCAAGVAAAARGQTPGRVDDGQDDAARPQRPLAKGLMMATRKPAAQTVLVTGASSGIGEALARRFARAGHRLVLVARSEARLASLASALGAEHHVAVSVEPADLTQPDAPRALASALKAKRIDVDILVNNAGVLHQGEFAAMRPERHHEMIALNVSALTAMLSHFVPGMI